MDGSSANQGTHLGGGLFLIGQGLHNLGKSGMVLGPLGQRSAESGAGRPQKQPRIERGLAVWRCNVPEDVRYRL